MTLLAEKGWPAEVIDAQLAHSVGNKVRAAYLRAEYLVERRKMAVSEACTRLFFW
jgi:hypothetical protein